MKSFFGFVVLFVITVAVIGGYRLMRLKNPRAVYSPEKKELYLYEPVNLKQLSASLVDSLQIVQNQEELLWAAKLYGWNSFKEGHYTIDGNYSYNQFLSKVAKGVQDPISVT